MENRLHIDDKKPSVKNIITAKNFIFHYNHIFNILLNNKIESFYIINEVEFNHQVTHEWFWNEYPLIIKLKNNQNIEIWPITLYNIALSHNLICMSDPIIIPGLEEDFENFKWSPDSLSILNDFVGKQIKNINVLEDSSHSFVFGIELIISNINLTFFCNKERLYISQELYNGPCNKISLF